MPIHNTEWRGWGNRLRAHAKSRKIPLRWIAGEMELAESTIRSFTNGWRSPSLAEFFEMCRLVDADPATILFDSPTVSAVLQKMQPPHAATPQHTPKPALRRGRTREKA